MSWKFPQMQILVEVSDFQRMILCASIGLSKLHIVEICFGYFLCFSWAFMSLSFEFSISSTSNQTWFMWMWPSLSLYISVRGMWEAILIDWGTYVIFCELWVLRLHLLKWFLALLVPLHLKEYHNFRQTSFNKAQTDTKNKSFF